MVKLDPLQVGGPYPMTVRGKNTITLQKVLVGEVWLCSGQSNMSLSVTSVNNAPQEIAAANYPHLRLISVPVKGTQTPQTDFVGHWAPCSPATVAGFSAVAYFFGRDLYQKLNIPIGLIHCSWGGSSCEAWVQRSVLESDSQYKPLLESTDQRVATWDQAKLDANYQRQLAQWKKIATAAKAAGKPVPQGPRAAQDFRIGQHRSANLYNGMLLPLIPYAIRGAIWYQGESNAGRAYQYRSLFPLMIRSWRHDWQEGDFPFYFVQLANFRKVKPAPAESDWAELREAQSMTLTLPHTGQAVIIDIGDADNIHPKNKQDVGKRLALWALAKDYCQDVIYSGPVYQGMKIDGSRLVLSFGSVGGGLVARGSSLEGFTIAGADRKFVAAEARIDGDTVVVSSPQVPAPVAVRYAWADNPVCNLYSQAGLPASGFRTDQWPGITAKNDR
jgi:sialate O-acetylesterase